MRKEYFHDEDKAEWGEGPWIDEPDKVVWVDEATDLDCMIHRGATGALCGYVGVPPTHPWYGVDYMDVDVDVHGTPTYSDKCQETATEDNGICHVPEPGREHDIWWIGFDCAHSFDLVPGFNKHQWMHQGAYKTVEWVQAEVERLAAQAAEAA